MTRPCYITPPAYPSNETKEVANELKQGEVKYTDIPIEEKNVYKLILDAYKENSEKVDDYLILTGDCLCRLIKSLTDAQEIQIEADMDIDCCGKSGKYNFIKNIICIDEKGVRRDFQIVNNKEYRLLQDYRISLSTVLA